jgi:hypothetical protein
MAIRRCRSFCFRALGSRWRWLAILSVTCSARRVQLHRGDGDQIIGHQRRQLLRLCALLGAAAAQLGSAGQPDQARPVLAKLRDAHRNCARVYEGVQRPHQRACALHSSTTCNF